ncbi:hypothetical protein BAE44_0000504 [Dichanthelium oligosanthes]|uniref:Gnk2-homologous domain-containing protein n=1 Tax=Dichanthelium oligosanthes TaxID=888268 RepID=A0A1E5WM88_9POAL|nr:hypothetical protein BAE44_0000504 [Dichanthelium oligosanthes]
MLLLLVAATVIANPGVAFAGESTSRHLPHLLDCTPAPTPSRNDSAFRANLAAALAVVTSGVAPEGSATVQSSSPDHRVFVRGICLSSSAGACPACLAAAAADLTSGCGASRRAGVWRDACFLAYADTDASTAREDAFRGWFNAGSDTTPALGDGECLLGTAARCIRCFDDALRAAPALGWLWRLRGGEVVVVSYTCYRRIKISVSPGGQTPHMGQPRLAMLLPFLFLVATARLGVALQEDTTRGDHRSPLLDCAPAPARSKNDDSVFRANLASALGALPSAAAAAPNGFATTRSGRAPATVPSRGASASARTPRRTPAARACPPPPGT